MGLRGLVVSVKTKLLLLRRRRNNSTIIVARHHSSSSSSSSSCSWYDKMKKSESTRIELRSRKAQKIIQQTLLFADSPHTASFPT
ncbi:hypothetical protein DM860_005047 [Cuscuta australis]|uniref:Uncharacterized protein n=1 Tax=Cuscuta australis TaxID=267555 RepID=A0A328DQ25_9ASTE|nr:hypothetical protein DM860_005047 [Cuscuta australis]